MVKPRAKNGNGIKFPYFFEKNGRIGRIKKWDGGKFGTYFVFAGEKFRNTFKTFEAAFEYLDREFSKLDTDKSNALALNPLNSDLKNYSELEQLVREQGGGATLREAVTFFLVHRENKRFEPQSVSDCCRQFLAAQRSNNVSEIQIKTLTKHFNRFEKEFGHRKIHTITVLEIMDWLRSRTKDDKAGGELWGVKTRLSVRGSLVSLSLYAQSILKAIPDYGKTEFQKAHIPKPEERDAVDIYTPAEFEKLLITAIETDIDFIPALVVGGFQGLRPFEFHAEGLKRPSLKWEEFNWNDNLLHVTGQKIRSKATRDIPLHPATKAWLAPFRRLKGEIWQFKQAYNKKIIALRDAAEVRSIYDGLRHSYASYRVRQLKQNLELVAAEMGNSPQELLNSYKRNVTDAEAETWFNVMPPPDYAAQVKEFLRSRMTD